MAMGLKELTSYCLVLKILWQQWNNNVNENSVLSLLEKLFSLQVTLAYCCIKLTLALLM